VTGTLRITLDSCRDVKIRNENAFRCNDAVIVLPQSALLHCQAPTLLLNRCLACLTGSSILVLKLTFSPDPFPRNLPVSLTD